MVLFLDVLFNIGCLNYRPLTTERFMGILTSCRRKGSGLLRFLFLILTILAATAISTLSGASPALACKAHCPAGGDAAPPFAALESSRECAPIQRPDGASLPEPLRDPAGDCRCLPHPTGRAGVLLPVGSTGWDGPATMTVSGRESTHLPSRTKTSPLPPPNAVRLDIFLNNSSLLI